MRQRGVFFSLRCGLCISTKRPISEIWKHSRTRKIWKKVSYGWYTDCAMSSAEIHRDYRYSNNDFTVNVSLIAKVL